MRLNKSLGYYIPSFFVVNINTKKDIENILNSQEERTLLHELVHFLQDLTTTYGLINICKTIDVIKDQNKILRNTKQEIPIPIEGKHYSKSTLSNNDLFSIYAGDGANKYEIFPPNINVVDIKNESWDIEGVNNKVFSIEIVLALNESSKNNKTYHFGAIALLESMAHIIEEEIYGKQSNNLSFPYGCAFLVSKKLYPYISKNKIALAELCEASLMAYHPAETFIFILNKMRETNFIHEKINDSYEFSIDAIKLRSDKGEDVSLSSEYNDKIELAKKQVNDLLTVEPIKSDQWASSVLVNACKYKMKKKSIVSHVFSTPVENYRNNFFMLIENIGFPILFNSNNEYWVQEKGNHISQPYFLAVMTFHNIMTYGQKECDLINFCQSSAINTNNACTNFPWKQKEICHFSQTWKMWGLEAVKIKI